MTIASTTSGCAQVLEAKPKLIVAGRRPIRAYQFAAFRSIAARLTHPCRVRIRVS